MPVIDLSRFKVIYSERVYNAVALVDMDCGNIPKRDEVGPLKPKFLDVMVINEDGNIVVIRDEAWMFQFVPIVKGGTT